MSLGAALRLVPLLAALVLSACQSKWVPVDLDGDGVTIVQGDCDDEAPTIGPDASEVWYNGVDENCDGNDADQDGDGYIPAAYADAFPSWADLPAHVAVGDCIDGYDGDAANPAGLDPALAYPGAADDCYDGTNADCDARGPASDNPSPNFESDYDCDQDGWMQAEECDDEDPAIYPNDLPDPWYDCVDANCDGNDGDQDGDGYVPASYASSGCDWQSFAAHLGNGDCWDDPTTIPSGYTAINALPQPAASEVYPGATDAVYDGVDADCEGDTFEFDADQDGYDAEDVPQRDGSVGSDCDDATDGVNPGQTEDCATPDIDDNCNGNLDAADALNCSAFYADDDRDGFGGSRTQCRCEPSGTYAYDVSDDCDDGDNTIYPGADEHCDDDDEDCDGTVDESAVDADTWYADNDNDGFGDPDASILACDEPNGYLADDQDCADGDATAYPGSTAFETPNDGVDQDCDGDDVCEDLNCDGLPDVLFTSFFNGSDNFTSAVGVLNDGGRFTSSSTISLDSRGTTRALVEDLNDDGYPDVVLANHTASGTYEINSWVYWGSASGYSTSNRMNLPTNGAMWVVASDLDVDGFTDLVFAGYRDDTSYTTSSVVYWGSSSGFSSGDSDEITTNGAREIEVADLDNDGWQDLVVANERDDSTYNRNSAIYWGSPTGYTSSNKLALLTYGASSVEVGDFDDDGYLDVAFANRRNNSGDYTIDSFVYWGDATASYASSTSLPTSGALYVDAADLDGDGYPELVYANYGDGANFSGQSSTIYWGSGAGYDAANTTSLNSSGAYEPLLTDVNGDGYIDVAIPNNEDSSDYQLNSYIYRGSASASYSARYNLQTTGAVGVAAGDLDGDGYTDLCFAEAFTASGGTSTSSTIYWGSSGTSGFSSSNASDVATINPMSPPIIVGD